MNLTSPFNLVVGYIMNCGFVLTVGYYWWYVVYSVYRDIKAEEVETTGRITYQIHKLSLCWICSNWKSLIYLCRGCVDIFRIFPLNKFLKKSLHTQEPKIIEHARFLKEKSTLHALIKGLHVYYFFKENVGLEFEKSNYLGQIRLFSLFLPWILNPPESIVKIADKLQFFILFKTMYYIWPLHVYFNS